MLAEGQETDSGRLTRIRYLAVMIAAQLGRRSPLADQITVDYLNDLSRAIPLHDIGKIVLNDSLPQRLPTGQQLDVLRYHTLVGAIMLDQIAGTGTAESFLRLASETARWHHERYDGRGYPDGLAGDAIPLASRIVAVADEFDSLTSAAQQDPCPPDLAKQIILNASGSHFDPLVVEALLTCFDDVVCVQESLAGGGPTVAGAVSFLQ